MRGAVAAALAALIVEVSLRPPRPRRGMPWWLAQRDMFIVLIPFSAASSGHACHRRRRRGSRTRIPAVPAIIGEIAHHHASAKR